MVKWISAQNADSPIANAITQAAATLWGDTITPELKRAQLQKLQREEAGAQAGGVPPGGALLVGAGVAFGLRAWAMVTDFTLPQWRSDDDED